MDSSWLFVCADCLPVNGRFHRGLKNSTSIFRFRRAKSVKGKLNDVFDEIRPKTPSSRLRRPPVDIADICSHFIE